VVSIYLPENYSAFDFDNLIKMTVTKDYFQDLGTVMDWLGLSLGKAIGAVVKLNKDYTPPDDWVIHTVRNSTTGDEQAWMGEMVSIYLPENYSEFDIY
jgi:hypothetical protein